MNSTSTSTSTKLNLDRFYSDLSRVQLAIKRPSVPFSKQRTAIQKSAFPQQPQQHTKNDLYSKIKQKLQKLGSKQNWSRSSSQQQQHIIEQTATTNNAQNSQNIDSLIEELSFRDKIYRIASSKIPASSKSYLSRTILPSPGEQIQNSFKEYQLLKKVIGQFKKICRLDEEIDLKQILKMLKEGQQQAK